MADRQGVIGGGDVCPRRGENRKGKESLLHGDIVPIQLAASGPSLPDANLTSAAFLDELLSTLARRQKGTSRRFLRRRLARLVSVGSAALITGATKCPQGIVAANSVWANCCSLSGGRRLGRRADACCGRPDLGAALAAGPNYPLWARSGRRMKSALRQDRTSACRRSRTRFTRPVPVR